MKGFIEIVDENGILRLLNVRYIKEVTAYEDKDFTYITLFNEPRQYGVDKRYEVVRAEILEAMK